MQEGDRALLEEAAKRRGLTVTAELLRRLRVSFAREYEERRDPAMRSLSYLIAELARWVALDQKWGPDAVVPQWNSDPFTFAAFRLAVKKLLDAIEPPGEVRPPEIPEPFNRDCRSPSELADAVTNRAFRALFNAEPYDVRADFAELHDQFSGSWVNGRMEDAEPEGLIDLVRTMTLNREREFHTMADARRNLGLTPKSEKGRG